MCYFKVVLALHSPVDSTCYNSSHITIIMLHVILILIEKTINTGVDMQLNPLKQVINLR